MRYALGWAEEGGVTVLCYRVRYNQVFARSDDAKPSDRPGEMESSADEFGLGNGIDVSIT